MKLYVEGGGDSNTLRTECRKGFSEFLKKAGLVGRMPRIVASGSRQNAFNDFVIAQNNGQPAMLLVDSESPVSDENSVSGRERPWQHLADRQGDQWIKPSNATDDQCHLMVECMESWLLADRQTLITFFGNGFNENALPPATRSVESVSKRQLYDFLAQATRGSKSTYSKGNNSFEILAKLDANVVMAASPWAKRFVDKLKVAMR